MQPFDFFTACEPDDTVSGVLLSSTLRPDPLSVIHSLNYLILVIRITAFIPRLKSWASCLFDRDPDVRGTCGGLGDLGGLVRALQFHGPGG